MNPRVSKNIYYFQTFVDAMEYANSINWPLKRIIDYKLGWAIQYSESSHYAGPNDISIYCCP